jgi:hypothetical protein
MPVGLDFDNRSGTGVTINTVHADKVLNKNNASEGRMVDGDRQQPNGHDQPWSF